MTAPASVVSSGSDGLGFRSSDRELAASLVCKAEGFEGFGGSEIRGVGLAKVAFWALNL